MSRLDPAAWARLPLEEVYALLGSTAGGLSERQAAARLQLYGRNELPAASRRPWYSEVLAHFIHLFALLLWAGAALAWLAGMPQLAWAIVAVILVNGVFSYWQEYQAERATQALQALLPHRVTVRRDGTDRVIDACEVVPGDVLVLVEGEAVPADARVVASHRLRADLSALTGESRPVPRSVESAALDALTPAALPNLVFAGTAISSGRGQALVFATGANTEFARIAELAQRQRERPSPLERELGRVTHFVTVVALALGALCFGLGTLLGGLSPLSGFVFAIGIIVANVPEGLLPTLSLALALAVRRAAARKALIKRLSAVEALGAATVILTDKTGTLTENEMTVREAWAGGTSCRFGGVGYDVQGNVEVSGSGACGAAAVAELLRAAALCCDARLVASQTEPGRWKAAGDPTEVAILVAAAKVGLDDARLALWPRLAELPFDPVRKRMTTVQRIDGRPVACVKGAPSEILPRCMALRRDGAAVALNDAERSAVQAVHDGMAERGLRVLAIAVRELEKDEACGAWRVEDVEQSLTLLGFVAMEDPPRPEVAEAVAVCRRAGLRVLMVTGDNEITAAAIGREIGLYRAPPRVVTGPELARLADAALTQLLESGDVLFARTTPEQKLRLVEALQRRGEVVAVTGDGVNDAPALKRADIGVAMGATGTDVAREAADMVLADDNFASIVAAIAEGRAVYDNVRKFVTYIFASNVPEIVPFVAFVLFGIPLPLTVMQILAIDLGTDLLPALALGVDPPEPGVMARPPRDRRSRLLDPPTLLRAYGWLGLIEAALSLAGYFFAYWLAGWRPGAGLADSGPLYAVATTMSLAGIVACQVGNAFACRSSEQSILRAGPFSNRPLLFAIGAEVALLLLMVYSPFLASVFGLAPLGPLHWALLAGFGPCLLALEEARKAVCLAWRAKASATAAHCRHEGGGRSSARSRS